MAVTSEMSSLKMVSFTASSSIVALGEEITIVCKIKNISGGTIKYWDAAVGILSWQFSPTGNGRYQQNYVVGDSTTLASISWADGVTKTFTWKTSVPTTAAYLYSTYSVRDVPIIIDFSTGKTKNSLEGDMYVAENVRVIEKYHNPKIDIFEIIRTDGTKINDEGEYTLTSIKLSNEEGSENNPSWKPKCELKYKHVSDADFTVIDLLNDRDNLNLSKLLAGVYDDSTIIGSPLLAQNEYVCYLEYGDDFEMAIKYWNVANAFSNFALSEYGKGASFGMFSRSTPDNPMLESDYPIVPYNGVKGINIFDTSMAIVNESGVWITYGSDGSPIKTPIYSVTVTFGALSASTAKEVDLGILGTQVGRIVSLEGMFDTGDGTWMSLMQSNDKNLDYHIRTQVVNVGTANNIKLKLTPGAQRTATGGHATIAFTYTGGEA